MDNHSIRKLEADLWESADLLRADSKLTSNQYCMPVLGLIFLRYACSRFKLVEQEILKTAPPAADASCPLRPATLPPRARCFSPERRSTAFSLRSPTISPP